jgi:hypothetical protein
MSPRLPAPWSRLAGFQAHGLHFRLVLRNRSLVSALVALLACLGLVSSSSASEYHLTGVYAPFADCPLSDLALSSCIVGEVRSGELVVGRRTVPIDNPFMLQGGLFPSSSGSEESAFVGAQDGDTLSRTKLSLPGGLAGILAPSYLPASLLRQFDGLIAGGATGVTMTPELAGPASAIELSEYNLIVEEGVAVRLPLKIKLSNPFLGGDCYIGSATYPIVMNLTTGATDPPAPNRPIHGTSGGLEGLEEDRVIVLRGTSLVDNAFAVPKATGCGGDYSAVVDPAIDAQVGLPSPPGHSTAIFDGNLEEGSAIAVRKKLE